MEVVGGGGVFEGGRVSVGAAVAKDSVEVAVTVSVGVSEYRKGSHFETVVAEADQALYSSKRSSKNCARAFGR